MDNNIFNREKAQELLDGGMEKAREVLQNNEEITRLIEDVQTKVRETPLLGQAAADLPVMIDMVKCYVTREYTVISPKVIATIVSAFLYIIRRRDLIQDSIPVLGQLDDIAVVVLALNFIDPELQEFRRWKEAGYQTEKPVELIETKEE